MSDKVHTDFINNTLFIQNINQKCFLLCKPYLFFKNNQFIVSITSFVFILYHNIIKSADILLFQQFIRTIFLLQTLIFFLLNF